MSEKRFKQFGLWIIDDPNLNVNSVADLIDTKLMSTNEVVDLLNKFYEENEQLRQKLDFYLLDEFEWKEKYGD